MTYHQMDLGPHQYSHMHQGLSPHQGGLPPQTQTHPGQPLQSIPTHTNQGHPGQLQNVAGHPNQSPHQGMAGHTSQMHQNVTGHSSQPHPGQPHPGQAHPGQQSHPGQPPHPGQQQHPGQTHPGQPSSGQSHPGQPLPGQPHPGQTHPGQLHPGPPHPNQPHLGQSHPVPPHPGQPHPSQHLSQPHPNQPHPVQSHPGQPHPGMPLPSQPHPGMPIPGQSHLGSPHSGQPHPIQSHPGQANLGQGHAGQAHSNQLHSGQSQSQTQPHSGQTHPNQQLGTQLPGQHANAQPVHSNQSGSSGHPVQGATNATNQNVAVHPVVPPHSNQTHQSVSSNHSSVPTQQTLPSLSNQNPNLHGPVQTHQNVSNISNASLQNVPVHSISGHQSAQSGHPPVGHAAAQQQMVHMGPYSQGSPHSMPPMGYNHNALQRSLDINVNNGSQYSTGKTLTPMDGSSPQYRAPFPQLSPQMSPRAQMSPRQQASQMSPRPVMSPAKPPNMSPHPHMQSTLSPRPSNSTNKTSSPVPTSNYSQQSTLQALEQMVLPSATSANNEYPYQGIRNPSPVVGPRMPMSPQQWQHGSLRPNLNVNGSSDLVNTNNNVPPSLPTFSKTEDNINPEKEVTESQSAPLTSLSDTNLETKPSDDSKSETQDQNVKNTDSNLSLENENVPEKPPSPEPSNVSNDSSVKEEKPKVDLENNVNPLPTDPLNPQFPVVSEEAGLVENKDTSFIGDPLPNATENKVPEMNNSTVAIPSPNLLPHSQSQSIMNIPTSHVNLNSNSQIQNPIIPSNESNIHQASVNLPPQMNIPPSMPPIPNMPPNMPHNIPTNPLQPIIPCPPNMPPNSLPLPPQINPSMPPGPLHPTMQGHMGMPPTMNPMGLPPQGPYDPTNPNPMMGNMGMGPRNPNIPLGPMGPGVMQMMPQGMMPHPNMYQAPISHHQERAALQQQLQEIYCMPGSPENRDKVMRLQERLNILQQHENNDKCNGGPQCILQNPMYGSPMIDSPQVSSTTGRGRSKGPTKPRKPRMKKSEKALISQSADNLPVSEDCVTPGTGLKSVTELTDIRDSSELFPMDSSLVTSEIDSLDDKNKKLKSPRKPREKKLKEPKMPKSPREPKTPKEKKKREPKDPNAPKRKRMNKKKSDDMDNECDNNGSFSSDMQTKSYPFDEVPSSDLNNLKPISDVPPSSTNGASFDDSGVTDFDDIPVSKIPIKELLEEAAAAKRDKDESVYDLDEDACSNNTPAKKKVNSNRRSKVTANSAKKTKRPAGPRRRKRGIVLESDGEPDDLISTPPPSPPPEGDCDSSKRRSARHTQRKKYTDDVLLRLSDDEFPMVSTSKTDTEKSPKENAKTVANKESELDDKEVVSKPNYVYINTTDEDSMIVQFILASRMGKRELILEPVKPQSPLPLLSDIKSEITTNDDENDKQSESDTIVDDKKVDEKPIEDDSLLKDSESKVEVLNTEDLPSKNDETENLEKPLISETSEIDSQQDIKPTVDTPVSESCEQSEKDPSVKCEDDVTLKENNDTEDPKIDEDANVKDSVSESVSLEKPVSQSSLLDVSDQANTDKPHPVMVDVEEFFVKYRNFSHLHCEWKTEEELYKGDKRIYSKIKRFKQKQSQQLNIFEYFDEEPFNPDYVEVERILDVSEHVDPATSESAKHYLVKWKSLQYEDSTWELEEDVDPLKIKQFEIFKSMPPKDKWKYKKRPPPEQWMQLKESPMYKGGNTLRPYQLEGLNWLLFSWFNGRNCILADEMGLGKTIQSLTFINAVWELGIRGPFLVIAPLSTIPNWQRELEGWTDMNVIVYHGSQQSRAMLQEYELFFKNEKGNFIKELTKFNVLITTFEVVVTDSQDLKNFNWRLCIIDEAHRLKNRNCKLLEGLRQLHLEHRVLLSGTPLQNNVSELFSLLNFLEPSQFSSSEAFLTEFGQLKTESEVVKLQALLKPMMLRRLKEDVEKTLAPKEETVIEVELTNIQKKYYRGILERNFSFLSKGASSAANIPNLMNTMMELRKCCIHPYLLNGAEDQIQYDYRQTHGEDHESYHKALIQSSGKMVLIDKLLPKLKSNGHRVLIFSQMVRCLDILEDYLMYRKYPFERIDGRIRGNMRQEAIDRFSKPDSDRFVFLLCTKAGGLGINLTAADTVIIYDSDWNPQNDLQAQARCHRIGQQKMVKIYRLLCRNTYEREMFDKASLKLGLDKAILQSMNTSQGGKEGNNKQLSKKEIEDLLKKGAYGAVMDDDNAGDKFCEEDIDIILARRTQIIQMESEKGSTFSKASFSSSGIRLDIDIDDPDFWKKWAKKAEIDPTDKKEEEELVMTEPRRRTQIKRYGHDDGALEMSDMDSTPDISDDDGEGVLSII